MPTEALELTPARSLFDIEDDYAALLNTDDLVEPQDQEQFKQELAHALKTAVDKRERFGQFILTAERRRDALKAEAKRLMDQAAMYDRAAERAREYGANVIESFGQDAKGKYRKLEGNTVVLSLRAGSSRVEFTDEAAVPSDYKALEITVSAKAWEEHIEACYGAHFEDVDELVKITDQIKHVEVIISKPAVKQAIDSGHDVPGADLRFGSPTLVIR